MNSRAECCQTKTVVCFDLRLGGGPLSTRRRRQAADAGHRQQQSRFSQAVAPLCWPQPPAACVSAVPMAGRPALPSAGRAVARHSRDVPAPLAGAAPDTVAAAVVVAHGSVPLSWPDVSWCPSTEVPGHNVTIETGVASGGGEDHERTRRRFMRSQQRAGVAPEDCTSGQARAGDLPTTRTAL